MDKKPIDQRNREIVREWLSGSQMGGLASKYKITRQRVWQIIRSAGGDVREHRFIKKKGR